MTFLVDADTDSLGVTYTVAELCALMSAVHHPRKIGFPPLGRALADLFTREEGAGPNHGEGARSVGLATCASVIYSNQAGTAFYVVHANAGDVTAPAHLRALNALGGNAADLYVAYAHPKDLPDYAESLDELVTGHFQGLQQPLPVHQRVPSDQTVRIKNLRLGAFGINAFGWLGY